MDKIPPTEIHMPRPSLLPLLMAFSLTLIAIGLILHWIVSVLGILILLATLVGWMLENRKARYEDEEEEDG